VIDLATNELHQFILREKQATHFNMMGPVGLMKEMLLMLTNTELSG